MVPLRVLGRSLLAVPVALSGCGATPNGNKASAASGADSMHAGASGASAHGSGGAGSAGGRAAAGGAGALGSSPSAGGAMPFGAGPAGSGSKSSGPVGCESFEACGGNPVGTWKVSGVCDLEMSPRSNVPECADQFTNQMLTATGSYRFAGDGTGTVNVSLLLTADLVTTEACARAQGSTTADVCTLLNLSSSNGAAGASGSAPATGPIQFDCTLAPALCKCQVREGPSTVDSNMTYEVSGNTLVITTPSTGSSVSDFCVSGDTLTLDHWNGANPSVITLRRQ